MWREKPPDAESAIGAASSKVWAKARTCPVHAVLGALSFYTFALAVKDSGPIEIGHENSEVQSQGLRSTLFIPR